MRSYSHLFEIKPEEKFKSFIRVNHVGEVGAVCIYKGQIKGSKIYSPSINHTYILQKMLDGELEHLQYFNNFVLEQKIRPTLLIYIWTRCSFLMGFFTSVLGENSSMACTIAVEEIIEKHYQEQIEFLEKNNQFCNTDILQKIIKFREDELEHSDIAMRNFTQTRISKVTYLSCKLITKFAIYVSKKI